MRLFAFCVLVLALASCAKKAASTGAPEPAPAPAPGPSAVSDRDRAQGTWTVVKVEWPEADKRHAPSQEEIDATLMTIKGDRITITLDGKTEDLSHVFFTEDATKTPRQINLVATDGPNSREPSKHKTYGVGKDGKAVVLSEVARPPLKAIYKFEGATLVLALPIDPDAARPTEFKPAMVKLPENRGGLESPVVVVHLKKK